MNCTRVQHMLDAWLDGELDNDTRAQLAAHSEHCASCTALRAQRQQLQAQLRAAAPRLAAPPALRMAVLQAVRAEQAAQGGALFKSPWAGSGRVLTRPQSWLGHLLNPLMNRLAGPRFSAWQALLLASGSSAASALAMWWLLTLPLVQAPRADAASVTAQVVALHAASLIDQQLIQVASSDRHTVKPWFHGKLDFAPPVRDLSADGFALLGARIDPQGPHQPTAALVYKIRNHPVNVFVWPATGSQTVPPHLHMERGFAVASWTRDGLNFAAVSDVDRRDLQRLAGLMNPVTP